jgi:hypothetical protein
MSIPHSPAYWLSLVVLVATNDVACSNPSTQTEGGVAVTTSSAKVSTPMRTDPLSYTAESLPSNVAFAIPSFVSGVDGAASAFSGNDLAITVDDDNQYYLGLRPRGDTTVETPRWVYSARVRNDAAAPARLEPTAVLKQTRVVSGVVARAIVVALSERSTSDVQPPLASVDWYDLNHTIVVMFAPALAAGEQPHLGGGTSLGPSVHYFIDAKSFAVLRMAFGR